MSEAAAGQPDMDVQAILDNMTDAFFRTDRDGRLLMASRSVENLLGWPREAVLGQNVRALYVDAADRQTFLDLVDAHGGRLSGHDLQFRRRDGSTVWVSASARRLGEDDGGGLEGVLHD
ncbi:MAG TPA: PAS domain-containing protein, partial [Magnetospirillum sp.]|nr:PAS domain-containing protein [Magnetospirillum sp.]